MKKIYTASALLALLVLGCKREDLTDVNTGQTLTQQKKITNHNNQFRFMKKIPQPSADSTVTVLQNGNGRILRGTATGCITREVNETRLYADHVLLDPVTDVVYIGSVLDAASITTGTYKPITGITRRPLTIATSLQGVQGNVSRTIIPSYSAQQQAINQILNQTITGDQPADISFDVLQLYSRTQLQQAVGNNFATSRLDGIVNTLEFGNPQKTLALVKFVQHYYTVNLDIPADGKIIEDDPGSFGPYSPVYVSGVSYGRMGLFFIQSTRSMKEISAALMMVNREVLANGPAVSDEVKAILNQSATKVYIMGGSAASAIQTITGYTGFVDFIKAGARYSRQTPGAMIAYRLRHLSDHSLAQTAITAKYTVSNCDESAYPVYSYIARNGGHHFLAFGEVDDYNYWRKEGVAFRAHQVQVPGSYPVHSFYSGSGVDHYFTMGWVDDMNWWQYQGVAFYAYRIQMPGTIPVYEHYSSKGVEHFYATTYNIGYPDYWTNVGYTPVFYVYP